MSPYISLYLPISPYVHSSALVLLLEVLAGLGLGLANPNPNPNPIHNPNQVLAGCGRLAQQQQLLAELEARESAREREIARESARDR